MKKIILLLTLTFIMCSCEQEIADFGIVTKVEAKKTKFTGDYETNYKVTIRSIIWLDAIMFTNELYNVGDTIKVTNQNNLKKIKIMNNEIKINVPEGMEIDKENSTFECIKFKPKWIPKRGDIATTGDPFPQIILVKDYIKPAECVGFKIIGLAVLSTSSNSLSIGERTLWVKQEASDSEKQKILDKLDERGYTYNPNDTRIIYEKEKELPKTWEEFCKNTPLKTDEFYINSFSVIKRIEEALYIRNSFEDANVLPSIEYAEAMLALCQLIQLRDCYNDGWKPDWNVSETKYVIHTRSNKLEVGTVGNVSFVLTFKTADLRDTFLNNFKDLIEQAKLLL